MREEVDLLEVPLVEVITAYLEDMESAGVIGYWDDMTEFLLLMSLLVEVKSRMLLPEAFLPFEEEELTPEEARDQLLERLFVYSQFKAAAVRLRELGEANARFAAARRAGPSQGRCCRPRRRSPAPGTLGSCGQPAASDRAQGRPGHFAPCRDQGASCAGRSV